METWIFMKHLSWNCRKQKQSRNWCVLVVNFFPFYSYSICFTVLFCKDMNDRSYVHIPIFFHIFPCTLLFCCVQFWSICLKKSWLAKNAVLVFFLLSSCSLVISVLYFVVMLKIKLDVSGKLPVCLHSLA